MIVRIGDYIRFRAACRWNGNEAATRKVNGFHKPSGRPTVRYGGYPNFVVSYGEILRVQDSKTWKGN
jgi:hypothetical protein